MRLERHKQGKYEFSFRGYDIDEFPPESLVGRDIEKPFLADLLAVGTVLVPVITTLFEGKHYLMDGIKRVLHCQYICNMTDADVAKYKLTYNHREAFRVVWAKMFYDISPDDRAAWSIIMNMQRDDNPIHTWFNMLELHKAGKLDEYIKLYRMNKQVIKRMQVLGELKEPEFWFEQYKNQKISEANLFALAKMAKPYQQAARVWKDDNPKEKFTVKNLKSLRAARNAQTILTMPNLPTFAPPPRLEPLFMILDGETLVEGPFRGKKDPGGYELYQLVKVG